MALYSEKVMDHFQHPRNVGVIENADGIGEVGNAKCGDIMKIYLKIDDDKISDVKFNAFGCGSAIATSSMATEMIKGKPVSEALQLTNRAVVEALDGLPAHKLHCSVLAEEAIKAAVKDYYDKHGIAYDESSSRTARIVTTVKPEKILIAMSGGVDSSVAALLLSEAGCECVGATMRLFHNEDAGVSREKSCCSLEDVEDARSVAYQLGMPFYVFNFTDGFGEQVMDRFVDAYERGATPNPCIDCNRYMKFAKLVERAELLGCDAVATGHYARIEQENGRWLLKKAVDDSKDQSYVLYFLNQHQLAHLRFPLGTLHKTEAREIAEKHGLVNARKRDSQDICFVPDGDYARVIELRTGQKAKPGPFVDREGHVLGEHAGIIHYTIGQRKGLGLGIEHPYYVCEKRPEDNTVVLGPNEALFTTELDAGDFNWIAYDTPPAELHVKAKIRYRQQEQPATVTQNPDGTVHVSFDEPQRAIARGQAVVLYDGDTVVGGGTIL